MSEQFCIYVGRYFTQYYLKVFFQSDWKISPGDRARVRALNIFFLWNKMLQDLIVLLTMLKCKKTIIFSEALERTLQLF